MYICPISKNELKQRADLLYCEECGYQVKITDGIYFFNPEINDNFADYNPEGLDELYRVENEHFWFINRSNLIKTMFDKFISKNDKIIEIGAGTGNVARRLTESGYNVAVGEIHSSGLRYAKTYGIRETYQFDINLSPFKEHFDVVGMFDVLEHIDNEKIALDNIHRMLKKDGKIVVTVPAHMWLWSREDRIAHHKRRYSLNKIKNLFQENGFTVLEAKYFFVSILPLLFLRRIIKKDDGSMPKSEEYSQKITINPLINIILNKISSLENKIIQKISPGLGGSIILVAKKTECKYE